MINMRRFVQLFTNITKHSPKWFRTTPLVNIPTAHFTEQKKAPTEQELGQIKQQAQQFYAKHIEDIIELERYQDWQQIVGGTTETLLIDFYADWCGPCKKLTPRLQQKVRSSGGKLKLLKINIDKFGKIAQSFQIKAVPTVYMVYGGKAIDAFSGQKTDEQLDKFLETAGRASEGDKLIEEVSKALEDAKLRLNKKDYEGAQKVLLGIKYNKVPQEYKLVGDIFLACVYSELGKMTQLKGLVQIMKPNALFYTEKIQFKELFGHLSQICQIFEQEKNSNSQVTNWKKKLEAQPNNLQLKFEAAQYYRQNQMMEQCLQLLLSIVKTDQNWKEKQANKQMLVIFKELGNTSPLAQSYRKLLQRALH